MLKTFDGTSYRRVGGKPGDRLPQTGFQRLRTTYTATGGETSVNLSALTPTMSYIPGQNQISIKRTSGGSTISGIDFQELTPTSIGFSGDPLIAGEIVEFIREFNITGVLAVQPRTDMYTASATAGQTLITADFSWPYLMNSGKGVGGVEVFFNGVLQTRGQDYSEVNLGTANTNQVLLVRVAAGGENIVLKPTYQVVDQTAATSTFNSQQLANIQSNLAAGTQAFVDASALITVPSTTIVGRAKIPNIAADLRCNMGIDRIMTQQIVELQNEFGPNGERVFSALNDDRGLIRFVGGWSSQAAVSGQYALSSLAGDFAEITFYGTGLNLIDIVSSASASADWSIKVDGTATTSLSNASNNSTILNARNYSPNRIRNVASGLTLGLHTVTITVGSNTSIFSLVLFGFEVINASASVAVNPGTAYSNGQKLSLANAVSLAYNTGVTGTKGGRQLVYLKSDGTVGNSFQAVDTTQLNLTAANHANEEIVRTYHFREFGASRVDDFSSLASSNNNRAFTLDDGTTTLVGINVSTVSGVLTEALCLNALTASIVFTFVGTGLDIVRADNATTGSIDTLSVIIDGVSTGSLSNVGSTTTRTEKVVSGLPYGTHVVKITATTNSNFTMGIRRFITYQPKKPALPTGAIELADYNVIADYAANTTGTIAPSVGVIRKLATREMTYFGAWTLTGGIDALFANGSNIFTATAASYVEYVFFGTGFDFKTYISSAAAANFTVSVDGSTNLSAYTTAFYSAAAGTVTFTASTGLVAGTVGASTYGNTIRVSGLPLGIHKVRVTYNSGATLYADCLDIITPIHSAKSNQYVDLQNTLSVGNQGISDNRKTSMVKEILPSQKTISQAVGINLNPTSVSSVLVPMPDMSVVHRSETGRIKISFAATVSATGGGTNLFFAVYVNGVQQTMKGINNAALYWTEPSETFVMTVGKGTHKVDMFWRVGGGQTVTAVENYRNLIVEDV